MRKSLIERMEARYRRRGYHTYGFLPGRTGAPEGWRGPLPDLLCQKGRRRLASLVRSEAQLRDPRELENIQAMLANRGTSIRLFLRDLSGPPRRSAGGSGGGCGDGAFISSASCACNGFREIRAGIPACFS